MGADLQFTLGLNGQQFVGTINLANAGVAGLKGNMATAFAGGATGAGQMAANVSKGVGGIGALVAGLSKLAGVYFGLRYVVQGFNAALEKTETIQALSERIGDTRENSLRMATAFKLAGLYAEDAAQAVNMMQKSLDNAAEKGGEADRAYTRLGLSTDKLKTMSASQQFVAVGNAIAGLQNPTERANIAMAIFSRSGGNLIRVFRSSDAMAAFNSELTTQQKILLASAPALEKINIEMKLLKANFATGWGFFTGFLSESRTLAALLTGLNAIDLSGLGKWISAIADRVLSLVPMLASLIGWAILKGINEAFAAIPGIGRSAQIDRYADTAENGPLGWRTLWKRLFEPPKDAKAPSESSGGGPFPSNATEEGSGKHEPVLGHPTAWQSLGQFVGPVRAAWSMLNGSEAMTTYEQRMVKYTQQMTERLATVAGGVTQMSKNLFPKPATAGAVYQ